jgi:Mycotoxin biosynthesis protein UstYa
MMPFESSRHFNISSYEGAIEWESVAPDNGLIYLGKERRPFTISMFHQLRCLDVIRKRIINPLAYISEAAPDELLHHCINYIRQMALCRVDVTLEQTYAPPTGVKNNAQICNNWERIYEEQKINYKGA